MSVQDAHFPDTPDLLSVAENAIQSANSRIQYFSSAIRNLGLDVRSIAETTFDLLLSYPTQDDIEQRKLEVVEKYSTLLFGFSDEIHEPLASLNRSWMEIDQSLGFYLLSTGRETSVNMADIRELIESLTETREHIPPTIAEVSNLIGAIRASAGGLEGLDTAIKDSTETLEKLNGELDLADSVILRQIILAERLHTLLSDN